jgi:hypothetical protein
MLTARLAESGLPSATSLACCVFLRWHHIVTAIINGKHPPELSAKRLMRLALKLPTDWAEQRTRLGFHEA